MIVNSSTTVPLRDDRPPEQWERRWMLGARAFSTHGNHWFAGWPAVSPDVEACVAIQNDDAVGGGLGKRIETVADDTEDTTKCSV